MLLNRQLNRCNCSRCQADRGARRSAPQPPVQRTNVRQPDRSIQTRTAPEDPPSRNRRPSLPAIGSTRRLGDVAASPEKLVAARCGGHPDPPLRDMRKSDIFTCRSNNEITSSAAARSAGQTISPSTLAYIRLSRGCAGSCPASSAGAGRPWARRCRSARR